MSAVVVLKFSQLQHLHTHKYGFRSRVSFLKQTVSCQLNSQLDHGICNGPETILNLKKGLMTIPYISKVIYSNTALSFLVRKVNSG